MTELSLCSTLLNAWSGTRVLLALGLAPVGVPEIEQGIEQAPLLLASGLSWSTLAWGLGAWLLLGTVVAWFFGRLARFGASDDPEELDAPQTTPAHVERPGSARTSIHALADASEPVARSISEPVALGVSEPVARGVSEPVARGAESPRASGSVLSFDSARSKTGTRKG